jgi:RNA polymerase sigma-B factor
VEAGVSAPEDPLRPLLEEYARSRDALLRDEIVLATMDLVEHIAQRYRFAGEPVEDIMQEGYIGLINAVEMFDPGRGVKFTTYATHAVQGAIQHYLRDKGKLIREPGWLHDLNQKINKATATLHQRFGREPTVEEVAMELSLPSRQVAEAVRTRDTFRVSSLEQPAGEEGDSGLAPVEKDVAETSADLELPIVDRLAIEEALTDLRQIERQVIYEFFFNDRSKTDIARRLGYSSSHISHLLRRALKSLKERLLSEERSVMRRQLRTLEGQLEHFAKRVEEETIKDDLTGLFNRRYILERLDEEMSRCARYGLEMSACLMNVLELPRFRREAGDLEAERVLCELADVLIESSRRIDRIGRYDETRFIFLLPHTGEQATVLCNRIRDRARKRDLKAPSGEQLRVVFGLAVYPASGKTVDELIGSADEALVEAAHLTGDDVLVIHRPPEAPADDER